MVRGHPRSSAMSPFDRAHMISYSSLIETMRPSCITVFEIRRAICRSSPTSNYPTYILPHFWAIMWRCLHAPMFSHFSRTPTCDRHTFTQTHTETIGHRANGHGVYREARAVKIKLTVQCCALDLVRL